MLVDRLSLRQIDVSYVFVFHLVSLIEIEERDQLTAQPFKTDNINISFRDYGPLCLE